MSNGWWRRLWRGSGAGGAGGRSTPDGSGNHMLGRFGYTCPVCGAGLGRAAPIDVETRRFEIAPSLRLFVGAGDKTRSSWQVKIVEGNYAPATSTTPPFSEQEVEFVYLLCGGGHFFPDAEPIFHTGHVAYDGGRRIDIWNMVAALGAPASGKTYLLLRTLHQRLVNEQDLRFDDDPNRVRLRELSPLENMPLLLRVREYDKTRSAGEPIPDTVTVWATPADILARMLPDAFRAIQDLIKKTMLDGTQRAESWGTAIRQPLVLRVDTMGRRTWTGVADLPGELFSDDPDNLRESLKLRAYDALVWVIDPVVAANAPDWIDDKTDQEGQGAGVLDGSLRPGSTQPAGPDVVRRTREQIQRFIGRQLTMTYNRFADDMVELLVAVNKCDLVHAALRTGTLADLDGLDPSGKVRRGVTAYLLFVASRFAQGKIYVDGISQRILAQIYAGERAQHSVREERADHLADGLLKHYSDHEAFWNLVHEGVPDSVRTLAEGMNRIAWDIPVQGIGDHIDACLLGRSARRLLIRDLVMSAIGCGVACGLGNDGTVITILKASDQNVRFFLCSPLATVPVAPRESPEQLVPRDSGAHFPLVDDRSAALTQLLLAMLGKVRR